MTLACRIHAAKDLRLDEVPDAPLGVNEVQMRLGAGGICGSDLHYFGHGRVGAFVLREPLIPGHEASGIVERVGSAVTRVKPGDKVAVNPSHACGRCDYCLGGRFNLCRSMFFLGSASVFPHAQGMFRERFVMGQAQLTPITEPGISLGEIVRAVRQFEGSPDPVQTASGSRVALEIVRPVWRELQQEMLTKLDDVTLEDLCQKAQAAGIQTDALQRLDFSI